MTENINNSSNASNSEVSNSMLITNSQVLESKGINDLSKIQDTELTHMLVSNKDELTAEEAKIKDLVIDEIISKVLEKKYGIPNKLLIFQEDIMALCSYGANFTMSEADDVRKAMGKKKIDLMNSYKDKFIDGWNRNIGIFGEEVWDKMADYAKYCFNKSHAVAYTLVTLKTAALQKYDFSDYMEWNYNNLGNEMKLAASNLMEKRCMKRFPTYRLPYEGIKFGSIEFKNLELTSEEADYTREYTYMSDLFLTSDIKYKAKFILRGLYDPWTKDILGLCDLKKKLGKKSSCGFGVIPQTNSFTEFLNNLQLKKYIRFNETPEYYKITNKVKTEPEEKDFIYIYKNFESMPQKNRIYRINSLIKEFGVQKNDDFDSFPFETFDEVNNIVDRYKTVFDLFKQNNDDAEIGKTIYKILLQKASSINNLVERTNRKLEGPFTCCVNKIDVMKNGSCKVNLQFSNGEKTFFTRDEFIKRNFAKHDIVTISGSIYSYQSRVDGYYRGLVNIKGV